jgi:hypothetical protein
VTHRLINELQKKAVPVAQSCRVLGVSRSGFYEAKQRAEKSAICKSAVHVRAAFAASGQSYGSRRVVAALANQGVKIGRYKVRSLMRREQLKPTSLYTSIRAPAPRPLDLPKLPKFWAESGQKCRKMRFPRRYHCGAGNADAPVTH